MNIERNAQRSRERLDAYRRQVEERMAALRTEFEQLKGELAWINERAELLARLADDRYAINGATVLQGADLREQAVILLATQIGADRPTHYKDWYDETLRAGFVILGKRPTATFLTAATRSPFVVRLDDPGYYRFDPDARRRLDTEADKLRTELDTVDAHVEQQQHLSPVMRKHRTGLLSSLRRVERQLAEAGRILDAYHTAQQTSEAA
jgi:DNA repair exonuclease SbcCD ATPase subunit